MQQIDAAIVIVIGTAVFGGTLGAALFQRLRIPQVVGYIVIGLLIGESGFQLVSHGALVQLQPLNLFALAVVGLIVGGELHRDTFRRMGGQLFAILLGEGLGSFLLVGTATGLFLFWLTGDAVVAAASGFIFGAIASATDPASTAHVLWEHRGRGVLTTTIIAIVALDDALAMSLYGAGTSIAQVLAGEVVTLGGEILRILIEIPGSIAFGVGAGLALNVILGYFRDTSQHLPIAAGVLFLVVGTAVAASMEVILATMALGVTLTNVAPRRSKALFDLVHAFASPIYVLFFVLVGARLNVTAMPMWLWGVVLLYTVGRTVGKFAGAYSGAHLSHAPPTVERYAGLGLFSQGGVAVGLSIVASQHLNHIQLGPDMTLGRAVVHAVGASTFLLQIIGPQLIRHALRHAGEIGRNVTEGDVVAGMTVRDVMDPNVTAVGEDEPLTRLFDHFSRQDHPLLPVVDGEHQVVGVVTLDGLKEVFVSREMWEWLVAEDVLQPVGESVEPDAPLSQATLAMHEAGAEHMIVMEHGRFEGVLDARRVRKRINEELVRRQQGAI